MKNIIRHQTWLFLKFNNKTWKYASSDKSLELTLADCSQLLGTIQMLNLEQPKEMLKHSLMETYSMRIKTTVNLSPILKIRLAPTARRSSVRWILSRRTILYLLSCNRNNQMMTIVEMLSLSKMDLNMMFRIMMRETQFKIMNCMTWNKTILKQTKEIVRKLLMAIIQLTRQQVINSQALSNSLILVRLRLIHILWRRIEEFKVWRATSNRKINLEQLAQVKIT